MTTYPLAQYSWDDENVITISSRDSQLIGTFPLDFLRRSGVSCWEYVLDITGQLLDDVEGGRIYKSDGTAVLSEDPLKLGDYIYGSEGECLMPISAEMTLSNVVRKRDNCHIRQRSRILSQRSTPKSRR